MVDTQTLTLVLAEPFMQRALIGGLLTGALGGLLGSVAVLRELSFFSDALGHSALLGITVGILIGVNPTLVLIPLTHKTRCMLRSKISANIFSILHKKK